MRISDGVALLDLLAARGTVAWLVHGDTTAGVTLVLDMSGLGSATRLLVARGFAVTEDLVPGCVELAHPHHGRVTVLPCVFGGDGSATWHTADGDAVLIAADAFDAVDEVPRRVRLANGPEPGR